MKLRFSAMLLLFLTAFPACEKEEEQAAPPPPGSILPGQGLFLANEGNFGWGNASLSYYDKVNDTIMHELFHGANGEKLGDVLQSVYLHDGLAYLVVNNSGKIEVVDPATGLRQGRIDGLLSPRYMEAVPGNRAYVTDLYANRIHIIDLEKHEVSGSLSMHGWTEAVMALHDKVFVSGVQSDRLYLIDPDADTLTDSLHVPPGPVAMVSDDKQMLWVLSGGSALFKSHGSACGLPKQEDVDEGVTCLKDHPPTCSRGNKVRGGGDTSLPKDHPHKYRHQANPDDGSLLSTEHPPTIYRIDPVDFSVVESYGLPATDGFYSRLAACPDGRYLYILGEDVLRMDTHSGSPAAELFIPAQGRLFYALAVDPENGDVYVSDAMDYVQRGLILRHNHKGELIGSQLTGIIPGHMAFH